uniref:Uncharacterized protein n=1 Tax=Macrostomum lignano TaxID=282301 RepID=A0A1I8JN17_9PLAT
MTSCRIRTWDLHRQSRSGCRRAINYRSRVGCEEFRDGFSALAGFFSWPLQFGLCCCRFVTCC